MQVENRVSFCSWHSGAKQILAQTIAKMPKNKAEQAIDIANKLEKKSVNHTLYASSYALLASPKNRNVADSITFEMSPFIIFKRSTLSLLKKMDKFIDIQAEKTAKIKSKMRENLPSLKQFSRVSLINDKGLSLDNGQKYAFSAMLAKLSLEKDGDKKSKALMKKVVSVNEKAKKYGLKIFPSGRLETPSINITSYYFSNKHLQQTVKLHKNIAKTVDKVEKIVDTYAQRCELDIKKDAAIFKKEEARLKSFDRKLQREAKIKEKWDKFSSWLSQTKLAKLHREKIEQQQKTIKNVTSRLDMQG